MDDRPSASTDVDVAAGEAVATLAEQIHQQREWLRVTLNSIGDAVIAADANGRTTFLNPVAEALAGWTADEAVGQPVARVIRLIDEQSGRPSDDPVALVLQSGRSAALANHAALVTKDGRIVPIEDSASPILDAAGRVIGAVLVFHDVAEKRRAEEDRARLAAIVESSDDAIVSKTLEGIIRTWNEGAERVFGYRADEIIGRPITLLLPPERLDEEDRILATLRLGKRIDHFETVRVRKGGERIDVSITVSPVKDGEGCVIGASKIGRDITERKRRERALAEQTRLLDLSGDAILVRDADNRISYWNRGAADAYGYSAEEALGKNPDNLLQTTFPEPRALIEEKLRRDGRWNGELVHVRKDGTKCHSMSRWVLDRKSDGYAAPVLETNTDITERKRAEEALAAAKAAAETANEAKSQFLAKMSHELRTPMNAILGLIDVALSKSADAQVRDCLETAHGSADLLLTLLDDLLDTAKIESGKLELESAAFSVREMLNDVARVLAVKAGEKGLSFFCRVAGDAPDAVIGDRTRLQQILLNLAGNAVKFTERGEVEIGLQGDAAEDAARLEFAIRDTGIGIAPDDLQNLFQPFAQADVSVSRRFGGTGLGLSICKSLVEMMDGRIRVESEAGRGSRFVFSVRLPLAKEPPQSSDSSGVLSAPAVPLRVLLAEDNPANQKLAVYILKQRGHEVDIANDGCEALDLFERNRYDAVLMDVQMPRMNGLEATAALRGRDDRGRRVPIIAVTAHAMKAERDRCLAMGMDGYLSKPVNVKELVELLESLARRAVSNER